MYNFVRAQTMPYPGAFTSFQGERLTIWSTDVADAGVDLGSQEGQLLCLPCGSIHAICGGGRSLKLLRVRFRDQDLDARDWYELVKADGDAVPRLQ